MMDDRMGRVRERKGKRERIFLVIDLALVLANRIMNYNRRPRNKKGEG